MTRPFVARGASFEEALERIARAGYRHLHFGPNDRRADGTPAGPQAATPEQRSALANLCARHDLAPISMFPRHGGDLAADTLAAFRADADTARALGVRMLIMWGPWPYRQGLGVRRPRAEVRARHEAWFAALANLAAHAEGQGVTITLKPHAGLTATSWELQDPGPHQLSGRARLLRRRQRCAVWHITVNPGYQGGNSRDVSWVLALT
jgi:sugar phosphate isomerase/epimerase